MCAPSSFTNWSLDGSVKHTVRQMVSEPGHRFESLESHCEGGIVRDFTICSNTNGLGLRSNAIKNVCPLILHQLVVGWIGKAHGLTTPIPTLFISLNIALSKLTFREFWGGGGETTISWLWMSRHWCWNHTVCMLEFVQCLLCIRGNLWDGIVYILHTHPISTKLDCPHQHRHLLQAFIFLVSI